MRRALGVAASDPADEVTKSYVDPRTLSYNTTVQTAAFTAQVGTAYSVDGSLGRSMYVTLPAGAPAGATCAFRKYDSLTATVNWINFTAAVGENIVAVGTIQLRQPNDSYEFLSDGAGNWMPIPSLAQGVFGASPWTAMLRDSNGRSQVADPSANQDIATKIYTDNGDAATLTSAKAYTDSHSSSASGTSAATPNALVQRDANGRAQVAPPAVGADIAIASYVDGGDAATLAGAQSYTDSKVPTGTSAATASTFMQRDANARAQIATPAVAADIANKSYADAGDAGRMRYGGAWSSAAGYAPNDVVTVNNSEYVCISQVVAPGGTALVASGAWTAASNAGTAPLLPNGAAVGDVLVLGIAWTGTTATETTPITGATKQNVTVYGTGSVRASLYTYALTATDIGNGYLTMAAQPATTTAQVMPYHLIRNFLAVNKTPLGTNGYNNSVTAQTPTSYPAWSYAMDWAGTASPTPSLTQASETNLVQGLVANQLVAAMGFEVVASGTNTARSFTGTNVTAATGGSYGFILSTTTGTPNSSPDLDTTHWTKLADANPAGALQMYAGAAAPAGWLLCDGTSVLRTSYPALFLALNSGNIYGTVDSTHFNLPDLRQRFPYGNNATASTLAATGGTATHTHPLSDAGQAAVTIGGNPAITTIRRVTSPTWTANITSTATTTAGTTTGATTQGSGLTGTTDAAATLPPYITVNFIIKT